MQQVRDPRGNRRTSRQQVTGRTLQSNMTECDALRQQLEETKTQLNKQKSLKEMYINREKETRRELERLQKYSNAETLSTAKIATQVRDATRQKQKKDLHKDYEELQVAHLLCQERFSVELQAEREKNKLLQEELERINVSHLEDIRRCESDVLTVRQQADTLQRELENERKSHADRVAEDLRLMQTLRAEQEALRQKMAEELKILQQNALEKEACFWRELEELKNQFSHQVSLNLELSTELEAEREKSKLLQEGQERVNILHHEDIRRFECDVLTVRQQADTLQRELLNERKSHADRVAEDLRLIHNLRAEQEALRQKMAEENSILQQNALEKEAVFLRELEELKNQLSNQISLNLELSTELEVEREDHRPRRKIAKREHQPYKQEETLPIAPALTLLEEAQVSEEMPCEQEETLPHAPALTLQEEAQVSEEKLPEPLKRASVWKRARHFLGLRKPQKWKRSRSN